VKPRGAVAENFRTRRPGVLFLAHARPAEAARLRVPRGACVWTALVWLQFLSEPRPNMKQPILLTIAEWFALVVLSAGIALCFFLWLTS
jgi:hypothetical protein